METTGRHPALIEFEGGIFAQKYHEDYTSVQKQLVKDAIAYWKAGGLVAICWHWGNPLQSRNTYPAQKMQEQGFLWNWFTTWHGRWLRKNDPEYLKRICNHELVVRRDELPHWK